MRYTLCAIILLAACSGEDGGPDTSPAAAADDPWNVARNAFDALKARDGEGLERLGATAEDLRKIRERYKDHPDLAGKDLEKVAAEVRKRMALPPGEGPDWKSAVYLGVEKKATIDQWVLAPVKQPVEGEEELEDERKDSFGPGEIDVVFWLAGGGKNYRVTIDNCVEVRGRLASVGGVKLSRPEAEPGKQLSAARPPIVRKPADPAAFAEPIDVAKTAFRALKERDRDLWRTLMAYPEDLDELLEKAPSLAKTFAHKTVKARTIVVMELDTILSFDDCILAPREDGFQWKDAAFDGTGPITFGKRDRKVDTARISFFAKSKGVRVKFQFEISFKLDRGWVSGPLRYKGK
ncbi:MAG: hypothetical protein ACYTAF_04235 [Planctomycetota bacterium]|jgi:hypothetical protein